MKAKGIKRFAFLVAGFCLVSCGGGSVDEAKLTEDLTSQSAFFLLGGEIGGDCGEEQAQTGQAAVSSFDALHLQEDSSVMISFTESSFSVWENGEEVLSGIWQALDGDTIRLTAEGETIDLDVEVKGVFLEVSLSGLGASCSS